MNAGTNTLIERLDHIPDLISLQASDPNLFPFLLCSSAGHPENGRYDLLLSCPGQSLELDSNGVLLGRVDDQSSGFLSNLDSWFKQQSKCEENDGGLPFASGWFLYLGYELAQEIEPSLRLPDAEDVFPRAYAVRVHAAIVIDRLEQSASLVYESQVRSRVRQVRSLLESVRPMTRTDLPAIAIVEPEPDSYRDAMDKIHEYILAGDVFQVNISRQWQQQFEAEPSAANLFRRLCEHNPAPFAALARLGKGWVISSSPERLVEVRRGRVQTRPIAGTRPRAKDDQEDQVLADELLTNAKERAEHLMLVDLERNDLGRVCKTGSIHVSELMAVEKYAHVHHIVSNVRGELVPGTGPGSVIAAVFPGGTITGCPKIRCMEIIAELEGQGRGFYTGALGYLNLNGDMDLNILIRTMALQQKKLWFSCGGGIVADSDHQAELNETRSKAKGLLAALQ